MTTSQMYQFARMGADARLKTIRDEQQAILKVFPELQDGAPSCFAVAVFLLIVRAL
jgi:hypothetical protein